MALTVADRQGKRDQATRLSVMGVSYTEIGKQLGISRQLTASLVKEELASRAEHNDQGREASKAHYREIIRSAWQSFHKVKDTSLNKSGHLNAAIRAQERIDKIDGNDAPKKFSGELTMRRFTLSLGDREIEVVDGIDSAEYAE